MKNLTKSIILLILYLTFYFNINLLDQSGETLIKIHPIQFAVFILASLLIIIIPLLRRSKMTNTIVIWACIYLLSCFFITGSASEMINNLYQVTFETILFLIAVFFVKKVAQNINDLEVVIQYVILPETKHRILEMKTAQPVIEDELIRSRRYDYPISALILKPESADKEFPTPAELERSAKEIYEFLKVRYAVTKMAEVIGNQTRRTDFIIRQDQENRFVIICPEITHQNAHLLADRLNKISKETLKIHLSYGIATFPDDGPSLQAILEQADIKLGEKISGNSGEL